MGGSGENKTFDDDSVSMASFEDVSPALASTKALPVMTRESPVDAQTEAATKAEAEEAVPDVQYVLQYMGYGNKILETQRSNKPFEDIPKYRDGGDSSPERKPVLEIVTRVSTTYMPSRRRHTGYRNNRYNCVVDYNDYDDYDSPDYGLDETPMPMGGVELRVGHIQVPQMKIHSEHLINALQAVVSYYPYVNLIGKEVVLDSPYRVLFHHRKALAEYKDKQPACHSPEYVATTAKHIDVLLEYLDTCMGDQIREEEERHKQSTPMATFEHFWLLLKPGEVIFAKRDDVWTPFIISNVTKTPAIDQRPAPYNVDCWSLECAGSRISRIMTRYTVHAWNGEQSIQSLEVIPAQFYPNNFEAQNGQSILEWQAHLGRMYWSLLQRPQYMEYDGLLVQSTMNGARHHGIAYKAPSGYMTGRVVVDAEGFYKNGYMAPEVSRSVAPPPPPNQPPPPDHLPHFKPSCRCEVCCRKNHGEGEPLFQGFEGLNPKEDTPPTSDLFYTVLTTVIPAFMLGDRRWGSLNLEHLKPVKTDREAFKWLVLDDEKKTIVKALIGRYSADENGRVAPWANDFVKNKGEGRIFLLHGSPGVGKTCTAECVAELTHRPLISLTSGDLSTDSYSVESNLNYFLRLGQRYGALVLLDEADVYLERRQSRDIARNGLVSVFLRALEYYRGVLFLTTNRVQMFDPAFTSRIHVALHYKCLTDNDRERIWAHNFERLDRDSNGRVHISAGVRDYAYMSKDVRSLKWNGREIRNAMQTAVALAENDATDEGLDKIVVADKHLRTVVKMSRGFKDFLSRAVNWEDGESNVDEEYDDSDSIIDN